MLPVNQPKQPFYETTCTVTLKLLIILAVQDSIDLAMPETPPEIQ